MTGTIFGRRRGRVHIALQTDPRSAPVLLVEMAAYSTGALVREMSSGLVRLALECEKTPLAAGTYAHHATLTQTHIKHEHMHARAYGAK